MYCIMLYLPVARVLLLVVVSIAFGHCWTLWFIYLICMYVVFSYHFRFAARRCQYCFCTFLYYVVIYLLDMYLCKTQWTHDPIALHHLESNIEVKDTVKPSSESHVDTASSTIHCAPEYKEFSELTKRAPSVALLVAKTWLDSAISTNEPTDITEGGACHTS